ncbi:bifunctional 2-polyprenyl-6-hydroxyphenol methylase/3-demethylubiquinol 3-O-methyltransferase UbiG [Thermococcus sp. EP1]|uniref:class I SAM-dependent methyltransferase n=1 Tax=Thermococcus sp. EP1 TaxID=1591054 RepID=UPI0006DD056D|nr:class I SAM-dependent methyltransferase [Thermococcus sp. EP1]
MNYEHSVKKYYSKSGTGEWERLVKDPYHHLEFETTMHFLRKYLPREGLILDAGGGPGRYTIELAKLGYDVVLLDLTPELLEIAKKRIQKAGVQRNVKQIIEGSIDDLSTFESNSFDGVICLGGVLSHIVDRKRREKAIDELIRVAKKNAPIFISVIGRLAVLVGQLVDFPDSTKSRPDIFIEIRDSGDYSGELGFAPAHFYLPEELKEELEKRNVEILGMVGLEGLASTHRRELNSFYNNYQEVWKIWWESHLKTCTHPSVVGLSEHFMIICRKV